MSVFRVYEPDELGLDGYPPEWHATLKHAVRAEAGHRCVRCFHPYRNGEHGNGEWSACDAGCGHRHRGPLRVREDGGEWIEADDSTPMLWMHDGHEVEARWRILTVHHLDGDKANCRWWNLAPLCQRCHLTIQGRVVMARVWPWEHTEWFRPYVAGFYAWSYLGEDLSREQVMERLDDLLGLERAA